MIDADGSGHLSVRELARFISGNLIETFDCSFPMADTGMEFHTNERMEIRVKGMEDGSPADRHPDMSPGLTLVSVNGEAFGNTRGNIAKLQRFLKTIPEGTPVVFTFKEPQFVCGEYSCFVDIQVRCKCWPCGARARCKWRSAGGARAKGA